MISYLFGSATKDNSSSVMSEVVFDEPPDTHVVFSSGQYHRRPANIRLQKLVNGHLSQYRAQWKKMTIVQSVYDKFMDENPSSGFVTKITSGPNIGKWTVLTNQDVLLPKIRQLFRNSTELTSSDKISQTRIRNDQIVQLAQQTPIREPKINFTKTKTNSLIQPAEECGSSMTAGIEEYMLHTMELEVRKTEPKQISVEELDDIKACISTITVGLNHLTKIEEIKPYTSTITVGLRHLSNIVGNIFNKDRTSQIVNSSNQEGNKKRPFDGIDDSQPKPKKQKYLPTQDKIHHNTKLAAVTAPRYYQSDSNSSYDGSCNSYTTSQPRTRSMTKLQSIDCTSKIESIKDTLSIVRDHQGLYRKLVQDLRLHMVN